ncbi:hypothetical protein A3Q24_05880 [Lactobacillus johnsonii]|uniref:Uncharacterized protein n=1 Tax=Lactobacillus johnsonii TaxID=33959 RepID=A0A267M8V4_LACJH|nr:hypothetical protein A3Q24_05880 [Lactobacillus johnsonii]
MCWELKNLIEDIDYIAQWSLEQKNIPPDEFYGGSLSNWTAAQNAKSREDREVDPLQYARQIGAI